MSDRKIPNQAEIQEQVRNLTYNIRHATIVCGRYDSAKYDATTNANEEVTIPTQIQDLDSLVTAIKEYRLALKEKQWSIKESKQRDSGISLGDRLSALSRDSFPIQESRDDLSGISLTDLEIGATCCAFEHNKHSDNEASEHFTSSEKNILDRQGNFCANRRPAKDRKKIVSETIPEEHH